MSMFSFDATAGASQSTAKPRLIGNDIYSVKFDGCESKDITGVKDPTQLYKVLILKFSNDDGSFEHTIFEPKPDDFKRTEKEFTNKNGNIEKIPQPSNLESLMLLFKHAIDAINPTVAKVIDAGEKQLGAKTWDDMRVLISKILDAGKGVSVKIKLLKNNKGEATFPGFFASVNRDGKAYIRNNFIGDKIAFTAYEVGRINTQATAKPSSTSNLDLGGTPPSDNNLDLNFDVFNL